MSVKVMERGAGNGYYNQHKSSNGFTSPISNSIPPTASPIPVPDPAAFNQRTLSDKKRIPNGAFSNSKPQCPSPPSKSPPTSRLGLKPNIYTPNAQTIQVIAPLPTPNEKTPNSYNSSGTTKTPFRPPLNDPNYFEEEFENLGQIGKGSFGEVYSVRMKSNKQLYAVKKKKRQFKGPHDRSRAIQEVLAASLLKSPHPHCLQYFQAWEEKGYLFIQTELCHQTLHEYMQNITLSEEFVWTAVLELALGLQYIHSKNLIHLDIKPGNILIGYDGYLKIADFGTAILNGTWEPDSEMEGDWRYVAPEITKDDPSAVSFAADVFSLGASIFEMASNITEMPRGGEEWHYLRSGKVSLTDVPESPKRSSELALLIQQMMVPNPEQRITVEQMLSHPILQSILKERQYKFKSDNNNDSNSATPNQLSPDSADSMELDTGDKIFGSREEFIKQQREQQRRESLETDLGQQFKSHQQLDFSEFPIPIAPKKLDFNRISKHRSS